MRGKPVSSQEISQIVALRKTGHSLPEIRQKLKRGNAVIFKYIRNVTVLPEYAEILKNKQGGSKSRAQLRWKEAERKAAEILGKLSKRDKFLILASLYWGEGNKREFNLINSDPELVKIVVHCLGDLGVKKEDLKISLRVYSDVMAERAISFWTQLLGLRKGQISSINVIAGRKEGKLPYGMCRVRITRGDLYFKLVMSAIGHLQKQDTLP